MKINTLHLCASAVNLSANSNIMEDNITFSIQNPEAVPKYSADLFIGKDSTLVFVFSIPADLGITELAPGDLFTIIVPESLLSSALAGNLSDPDWEVQSLTLPSSNDPNYTFVLTPQSSIQVNGTVDITFKKLQGKALGQAEVNTHYTIGGVALSGSSEKLFVLTAPNGQLKDLNDDVDFTAFINYDQQLVAHDLVYISPENLQPPIANRIHLNLAYNGHDNLIPNWPPLSPPQFIISFSYGTGSNDLTDAIQSGHPDYNALTSAWSIKAAIDQAENTAWNLPLPNTADPSPSWVVEPAFGNQHLLTHDQNLDVIFEQIITVLPKGVAHLYVQWANIPGYNAGVRAVALNKQVPQQAKLDFTSPQDGKTIDPNTPVTLNWQAFAAENLKITWDGGFRSKPLTAYDLNNPQLIYAGSDDTIVPDNPESQFLLNANFDPGTGTGGVQSNSIGVTVSNFPAPTIQQFSAALGKDASGKAIAALGWLVENLGNEGYFLLNGERIDGSGYNGNFYTHPNILLTDPATLTETFTLVAENPTNSLSATKTIQATVLITGGTGSITRDTNGNPRLTLNWKVNQAAVDSICLLNGVKQSLNADGSVQASIAITSETPLRSSYTLSVQNPGSNPLSNTLTVNFNASGQVPYSAPNSNPLLSNMFLCNLLIIPNSLKCLALYVKGDDGPGQFQIAQFDAFNPGKPDFSPVYYFHDTFYSWDPKGRATLSISPDGTQLYITLGGDCYYLAYDGQSFPPSHADQVPIIISDEHIRNAMLKDQSLIFFGLGEGQVVYFEPKVPYNPGEDLSSLPGYGSLTLPDADDAEISAICINPVQGSKQVFIGDSFSGKVYYFNSDNINANQFIDHCDNVADIAIAQNGRLYLVGTGANGDCRLHTLDTLSKDYTKHPFISFGNDSPYLTEITVKVSLDNSFVLVPHNDYLHIFAGATPENNIPTLLQSVTMDFLRTSVITPDNSRIYVALGWEGIQILEPIVV